jgi:hypothetical protein
MKRIFLLFLLACTISACGNSSTSENNSNDPNNKPAAVKHIEPGTDLTFTCVDTFYKKTVLLHALWNSASLIWELTAEEFDSQGTKISEMKSLIGNPDAVQKWQMTIRNGSDYFGKLAQNGSDQAMFYGPKSNMQCSFN